MACEPLTPPDCDLRGLAFMPLEVARLRDSDLTLTSSGDEFKAAVLLWCAAWAQVPAASLPDDERLLARLCGLEVKLWRRVRAAALRGWVLCDDGRLYHPVVAQKAREAWQERIVYRQRRERDRERLGAWRQEQRERGEGDGEGGGGAAPPPPLRGPPPPQAGEESLSPPMRSEAERGRWRGAQPRDGGGVAAPETRSETRVETPPETRFETRVETHEEGTGRGRGKERKGSNDPSLSTGAAAPERAGGKIARTPIPAGYPDGQAVQAAASLVAATGAAVDVAEHARRFRAHALAQDRRAANWGAAWTGWVQVEIGKASPRAQTQTPAAIAPWPGPAEVRARLVTALGEPFCVSWLDRCGWRAASRTVLAPGAFHAQRLGQGAGALLAGLGISIDIADGKGA